MNFTKNAINELHERRGGLLTPLIDVVFLLLIFLLFGDFHTQEGHVSSRIEAADGRSSTGCSGRMLLVVRQEAGVASVRMHRPGEPAALYVSGLEQLDAHAVRRALQAVGVGELGDFSAVISTEGTVDFRHVMRLWDRCRQLGFSEIGLREKSQGGGGS